MPPLELLHPNVRDDVVLHLTAGTSVTIVGPPGAGRSTLLRAVADVLDDRGWTVVRVHGVRALRDRPLEALAIPGLVPRADSRGVSAVSSATTQLQTALDDRRSVLMVDDVDVLDDTSCGVIAAAYVQQPFPILTSSRPRRRAQVVPGADIQPATSITLPALGFDVFQDMLADLLPGDAASGLAGRLFTLSGGLPRLAVAILDLARQHGGVQQVDGVWDIVTELFSVEAAPAIEPFLDDLHDDARTALESLAVVGAVPVGAARTLTSSDALAALENAGLLRFVPRGDDLVVGVFPHAVAEYLRRTVPRVRRLDLDEQLRATLDPDRPPAVGRPQPVWFPVAASLVDPLGTGAEPEEAGTVLNRMFLEEWYRDTLARRAEWEAAPSPRTGLPYLLALLVGGAEPAVVHAVTDSTPTDDDPASVVRWTIWRANVAAEIDHDLPRALRILRDDPPDVGELNPMFEANARRLEYTHGTVPEHAQTLPAGTVPLVVRQIVERVEGTRRLVRGDASGALSFLGSDPSEDHGIDTWGQVARGIALISAGRTEEALAASRVALERGRANLDPDLIHGHGYVVSLSLLLLARTRELRVHLGTTLSIGLRTTLHRHYEAGNRSIGAVLAALQGRTDTARALARQATTAEDTLASIPLSTPTFALGLLDVRESGESPDARRRAADALWAEATALFERRAVLAGGLAGGLAVDLSFDARRLATLEDACADATSPLVHDVLRLAQAAGSSSAQDALTIGRHLVTVGQVMLGARALAHGIGLLQADGDVDAVRETLADARRLVRQHGGEPGAVVRPVEHAVGLTERELEIAALVVAGGSNEDIALELHLSVRTVQNTIGRVVAKLGLNSRNEITRELLGR